MRSITLSIALALLIASLAGCSAAPVSAPNENRANPDRADRTCLDLNTATAEQLESLPGIGPTLAAKIIDYRNQQGGFRRAEEIIIIEGLSERKYRDIARLVCVK